MDYSAQYCHGMGALHVLLPLIFCFLLAWLAVIIVPFWMIFKKAGFPPALAFLMILPLVNLVLLYVVAFSQWKVVPAPVAYYPPPYTPPAAPPPPPQV